MKKYKYAVLVVMMVAVAPSAHAGFLSSLVHFISHVPLVGNIVDHYANMRAQGKVNDKLEGYYQSALRCRPIERDGQITATDLMRMKPGYPDWRVLEKFEGVARSANAQATALSTNDKVRHCYAGCIIRRNLGYSAGVLAAFTKELSDASDCNPSTHFEMQDYYATIAGVEAGGKTTCSAFCGTVTASRSSGSELLTAAKKLTTSRVVAPIYSAPYYAPQSYRYHQMER